MCLCGSWLRVFIYGRCSGDERKGGKVEKLKLSLISCATIDTVHAFLLLFKSASVGGQRHRLTAINRRKLPFCFVLFFCVFLRLLVHVLRTSRVYSFCSRLGKKGLALFL